MLSAKSSKILFEVSDMDLFRFFKSGQPSVYFYDDVQTNLFENLCSVESLV